MKWEQEFKAFMLDCGYDVDGKLTEQQKQVVTVAKAVWNNRQITIDYHTDRIANFKHSLRGLIE